ncbi:MAG TPA: GNAT family N-acetyltransferase [Rhodospirillaceae bacterium]|nr:GNAT family N-acetyltransferase [Rhodospirillaceae bacterium]
MSLDKALLSRLTVEPLHRQRHDRDSFCCGVDRIDNFLKITAGRFAAEDHGKVYVAIDPPSPMVLGFFALSPHAIDIRSLPEADRRRMPRQPAVSAIYLSMVGIDQAVQGCGVGTFLMTAALCKCIDGANLMGGHFVVLDAIDEHAARLYRRLGFIDLPSDPGRMLLAMRTLRRAMESVKIP